MAEARRDRRGRIYWVEPGKGRVKAPADVDRPRGYGVDKLGRGYWTFLDTGRRAPKPAWDEAPRYDSLERPLDTRGRRVPAASLQAVEVALVAPTVRKAPPKKAARRVRPAVPPRPPRASVLGPREMVTGFKDDFRKIYTTRPTQTSPKGLEKIFESWAKGAVNKSPVVSDVDEFSIRQHGVVFVSAYGGLDNTALAELNNALAGQPVRMVYRSTGPNEMEIWMHLNRPDRRTGAIEQRGHGGASGSFKGGEAAANIIYDFLMDYDAEFAWYEYIETDEDLYEG